MRIIAGSTNQNDPKYGPRAGKQCMSNCFSFLHTVYLNGINNVLNKESIDIIMENGALLDNISTTTLKLETGNIPEYRFFTEIPKKISSNFGETIHELSRPFNGTLESQHIDNEVYLGLLDFLLYGKNKKPAFIVITIGVMARAIFIVDELFYLFDSHASDTENSAAIYICEDIDELYALLAIENVAEFYYDAVFSYFIETTDLSLEDGDATILILKTYKDPDIALSLNDFLSMYSSTSSTKTAETNTLISKQSPSKRKQEKTSLNSNSLEKKRKQGSSLKYYNNEVDLVPSFYELRPQFNNILFELSNFPIVKENVNWTLYIQKFATKSTQPFTKPFIWNRVFHLFSQVVDALIMIKNDHWDETQQQKQFFTHFLPFKEFSEEFENALEACRENNLDLILLYKNYLSKTTAFKNLERILLTKFSAIVSPVHEKHYTLVNTWLTNLIQKLVKHPEDTNAFINDYVLKNPLNHFICLNKKEKQSIALLLNKKRMSMLKDVEIEKNGFVQLQAFIENIGEAPANYLDPENARKVNVEEVSEKDIPTLSTDKVSIPNESMFTSNKKHSIEKLIHAKLKAILSTMGQRLTRIIQENYNNIAAGFLPVNDLNNLFAYLVKLYFDVYSITINGFVVENELIKNIEQIYDNTQYLRFGLTRFNMQNLTPFTISVRKMFLDFFLSQKTLIDRAEEIIENLEFKSVTPEGKQKLATKNMLREQLEQLNAMDVDDTINLKTDTLTHQVLFSDQELRMIQDFILQLSIHNIPSINFVKSLKLHIILEKRPDILLALQDKVQNILYFYFQDLVNEIPAQENVLSTMLFIIELFPADSRIHLLETGYISRHIVKKWLNMKSLQDAEDLIRFININKEQLGKFEHQPFGKEIQKLIEKIHLFYKQKVIEYQEDVWSEMAKNIILTSPSELSQFLASAPTQRIIQKHKNNLDQKLLIHMENQAKQAMEDDKKRVACSKINLERHLNDLLLLLKDRQFASIQASVLIVCENIFKTIPDDNLIIQFSHALLSVLLDIEKDLKSYSSEILEKILINRPLETSRLLVFKDAYGNLKEFLNALKQSLFATADVQNKADFLIQILDFTYKFRHKTNKGKLLHSIYNEDFKLYEETLTELRKKATDAKESLTKLFKASEQKIELSRTIPLKEIYLNIETVNFQGYGNVVFRESAFKRAIEVEIKNYEMKLNDLIKHFNSHLKTKIDHMQILNLSFDNKWKDFVSKSKISFPPELTISSQELIKDPIKVITETLNKASNDLAYVISEKILKWLIVFVKELNTFFVATMSEFGEVIPFDYKHFRALEYEINSKYIEIENKIICNEIIENTDNIEKLSTLIKQIDPNRIAGGKQKFQDYLSKILTAETNQQQTRYKEQLKKQYFDLLDNIAHFRFAFDFNHQQNLILKLKDKFKTLRTDTVFERFPNLDDTFVSSMNVENFLQALEALSHFVQAAQNFLQNVLTEQADLFPQTNFIPVELSTVKTIPKSDINLRMKIHTPQTFFQVDSVFNTQLIVDEKGIPVQFYNVFHNIVFKFFALNYKKIIVPDKVLNLVSTKYKILTTLKSILSVVKSFWKEIINFDLTSYFQGKAEFTFQNVFPIINLKIFIYIITQAWSVTSDETQHSFELPLEKFSLLIIANNPEFLFGSLQCPVDLAINSLIPLLEKKKYFTAFTISDNPPKLSMDELKIVCLDLNTWSEITLEKYTFKKNSLMQLCMGKEKFFIYLLSALVLPQNFLNYIWIQYKPSCCAQDSFQQLIQDLCFEYTHQNHIKPISLNLQEPNALKHGERILSKFVLEKNANTSLFSIFLGKQFLLDYLLFSYLTATEMTFSYYVDSIKNFLLTIRHLENVQQNVDFRTILQSRNFDLKYLLTQSWTQNVLEQSIFHVQLDKIIADIKQPQLSLKKIPLVLFNGDNEVVSTYVPPEQASQTEQSFRIKNIFPNPVQEYSSKNVILFTNYPKNTKFLFNSPPPKTAAKSYKLPDTTDDINTETLSSPTIQRIPIKGLVPKENEIVFLPEKNTAHTDSKETKTHLIDTFNILSQTKGEIKTFSTDFDQTISKLKHLYF